MPVVRISGRRSGRGAPTWGQHAIRRIIDMLGERAPAANLGTYAQLPEGTDTFAALAWIGRLVGAHDALRTRFVERDGELFQVIDGEGSFEVGLVDPAEEEPEQAVRRLRADGFRLAEEWPVRFALFAARGRATGVVCVCSHAVADAWGMRALEAVLGTPGAAVDPGVQSLDQALFESSPQGVALDQKARAYWHRQLSTMPVSLFPAADRASHEGTRFWYAGFSSPLIAAALPVLAHRHRSTTMAVLHAAVASAFAAGSGLDACPLGTVAANRSRRGTRHAVGSFSQLVPITLRVAGRSWDELVRAAADAELAAFRHGAYHLDTRDQVTAEVERSRGARLDLSLWFNDTRPRDISPEQPPPSPPGPVGKGVPAWGEHTDHGDSSVYFYVGGTALATSLHTMFDTTRLSLTEAESLLEGVEDTLGRALDGIGSPHAHSYVDWARADGRWLRVDGSWVDGDAVERIIRKTGDWTQVAVEVQDGALVARLTPRSEGVDAGALDGLFLGDSVGRAVMAPRRYVIGRPL